MILLSDAATIGLVAVIVVAMAALSVGLYFAIKKEKYKNQHEDMIGQNIIPLETFRYFLDARFKKAKLSIYFTIVQVAFDRLETLVQQLDQPSLSSFLTNKAQVMLRLLPHGSKVVIDEKEQQYFLYIPYVYEEKVMMSLLKQIKKMVDQPYVLFEDLQIDVTTSFVYAIYPDHGSHIGQIFDALKIALYNTVRSGGNTIKSYAPEMSKNQKFVDQYYALKSAIIHKEFRFYYQPIVDNKSQTIYGVEALLRWDHPTKGIISPREFMPMLETSGDIDWVGLWGLETVITVLDNYRRTSETPNFKAHININPRQLMNDDIVSSFQNIITKTRFQASDIVLELNDFEEQAKNQQFIKTMIRLQSIGFLIAIDMADIDYQTLSLVEKHHISIVKLSRGFVLKEATNVKDKFIKDLVLQARNQKLLVIAEGIEDTKTESYLASLGVSYIQGFLYSEAMTEEKLLTYTLKKNKK